jgi:glycosyltransferase involved in cell wall biosynthesis
LRLLFVCSTLTTGGFERHLSQLVPGLRDSGHHPIVLCLREEGRLFGELRYDGIEVHGAKMRSRTDLVGIRRALAHGRVQPDVVVSQSVDAHVVASRIAGRGSIPHVALEHSAPELLRARRRLHRTAYRWLGPRVDRVVAVSTTQLPELVRLGYPAASIRVIPNGIPEMIPDRGREEVRAELGLDVDCFVATLVATLRPEKRAELFVDAVVAAHDADSRVRGLVVGDGPEMETVRRHVAAGQGAVEILGERADIPELMNASDVIGLSSVAECLPLTVLEAMALSRPVIGTDVGGMAEPVADGETGLLVPAGSSAALASAILELSRDPARAAAMGAAGRRRYEDAYTLGAMVESYSTLFRDVRKVRCQGGTRG